MHSKHFEKVQNYYNQKLWSEERVADAVRKGWITQEEYEEILSGGENDNLEDLAE